MIHWTGYNTVVSEGADRSGMREPRDKAAMAVNHQCPNEVG